MQSTHATYPVPQWVKSRWVWNANTVRPTTTPAVKKKACNTTETS